MAKMHILFFKLSINSLSIHFKNILFYFTCILYLQCKVGETGQRSNLRVGETGVGEMGVGETGQILGEMGVCKTGVGEMGVNRVGPGRSAWVVSANF